MKKAFLVLAGLGLAVSAFAQRPFICTTEGAKLVYVTTDAKGNENGQTDMEIVKVVTSGDDFNITQKTQLYVGGVALSKPIETVTTVKGGDVLFDFGGIAVAADGGGFVLPKNLEVGMELPKGEVTVEMLGIKSKQNITSHQVVAKETLTVPAGTYECYVVERKFNVKVLGMKTTGSMKTWYARGIGAVRTDNFDKKGKVTSSQVLKEVVLP